jgi:hypothetical protein
MNWRRLLDYEHPFGTRPIRYTGKHASKRQIARAEAAAERAGQRVQVALDELRRASDD